MDRSNIEKIAQTPDDRLLLAKVWDKIYAGMRKNIFASSCFLSPREQELCRYLFGSAEGLHFFGGYEDAERRMLVYLPEYLDRDILYTSDSSLRCLRAAFYRSDSPTHRDFLGALMGAGIARETVGDICVSEASCDFFVTQEIAPFLLSSFTNAGKVHLQLSEIPIAEARIPQAQIRSIRDTLASLRLDSAISTGFRIGRAAARDLIVQGRAAMNGMPCDKPDKTVSQGMKISVRGLGKIEIAEIGEKNRKGRIPVMIHRYV